VVQVCIRVPEALHEAIKKVCALECRSINEQGLYMFYMMCLDHAFNVPIDYEENQKLERSARKELTPDVKRTRILREEWEQRKQ